MPSRIQVSLTASARSGLNKIPYAKRIDEFLVELQSNPLPRGVEKLAGCDDAYKKRFGAYRVKYLYDAQASMISVIYVGRRESAY